MKLIFICVCSILIIENAWCAMTEAQLKSAAKLLKNVCQPKTKVTNEQLEVMHKGTFSEDPVLMSYMECILRTGQIMKDGKLNYEALKTQLANLPAGRSEQCLASAEHCKDSPTSSDKYMAAYQFYKCWYEDNPANFFLP